MGFSNRNEMQITYSESEVLVVSSFDRTMKFDSSDESMEQDVKQVMLQVHAALEEKGYNPINQIVGYLLSGDPAYIPRHQDARNMIRKLERDEILEELVKFYIKKNNGE
jgi:uncharacterized protein (UPF0297 family)